MSQGRSNVYKLRDIVNVKDPAFGAKGDGASADYAGQQAAINALAAGNGGYSYYPPGTYLTATKLTLKNKVVLKGEGIQSSIIKGDGAIADAVVETEDFTTLTGTDVWLTSAGMKYGFGLSDIKIDGGGKAIWGLRIYGKGYTLDPLLVYNCASGGVWSEGGASGGQTDDTDMPEAKIDLRVHSCGGVSFDFRGPHDAVIERYVSSGQSAAGTTALTIRKSATYHGGSDWKFVHVYAHENGVFIGGTAAAGDATGVSVKMHHCISESMKGGAFKVWDNSSLCEIHKLELYGNGTDATAAAGKYDAEILGSNNYIGYLRVSVNAATPHQTGALLVQGGYNQVNCNLDGNGNGLVGLTAGSATGGSMTGNMVKGSIRSFYNNGTGAGTGFKSHQNAASSYLHNRYELEIADCLTVWNNGVAGTGNRFDINSQLNGSIVTAATTMFTGTVPNRGGQEEVKMIVNNKGTLYKVPSYVRSGNAIALDSTAVQTLTIAHLCPLTPKIEHCSFEIQRGDTSGAVTDYVVSLMKIDSVDATNVTAKVKLGTASGTAGATGSAAIKVHW
ncbi:MAG TPA: glycosyl hydrolase family 28-related protein [Gemmatimonadales bacterium]